MSRLTTLTATELAQRIQVGSSCRREMPSKPTFAASKRSTLASTQS